MDISAQQAGDTMERNKFLAAYIQSGFRLRIAFQLLDEIEKHQQGKPGLWQEYAAAIEELSQGILKGELTRYNLDDEYVANKCGVGEGYESYVICDLAFYLAGCNATKKEEKPNLDYLEWVEENMDSGFFVGFKPRQEVLMELVKSIEGKALEVASRSRDMESRERSLRGFCEELEKETDEDTIIGRINHFNDGSYVELAQDIRALSYILKRREYWNEYYKLLENLRYFPLQGSLIIGLRNTADIFAVISQVVLNMGRKSLHYLLREQFFKIISEEGAVLRGNAEEKTLKEGDRAYILQILEVFENEKKKRIEAVVDFWLHVFGKEEMTVWLSRKRAEAERKHEKYGKPELEIVEMMEGDVKLTTEDIKGFLFENKDFASLITLAAKAEDSDVCKSLMGAMVQNIFSDHSYPETRLDAKWFEQVRIIYRCLKKSGLDGLALLKDMRSPIEGFKVDLCASMRGVRQEAYWLAMLLLSLEESGNQELFGTYVDLLFKDTRYSIDSLTDDVFTPYYVAELLVSQVMPEKKDEYEKRLIEEIPYLVFVIRVLTANEGKMTNEVRALLKERIQKEWEVERKLLSQNKMVKLGFYDEFVKEYL